MVLSLVFVGCETTELFGPDRVDSGQLVTYTLEMEPYFSRNDATVYVVAEIPESWDPIGWAYEGEIDGGKVLGEGGFELGEPGLCSGMPAIPYGYKRIFASDGPFATLVRGRDLVTANLEFTTGAQPGVFELRFFVHVKYPSGVDCGQDGPDSIEVIQDGDWEWKMVVGEGSPVDPGIGGVPGRSWGWREYLGRFFSMVDGRVWSTVDFVNWEMTLDRAPSHYATWFTAVFDDRLFVVFDVGNHYPDDLCQIWSTSDGTTWELVDEAMGWPFVLTPYGEELVLITKTYDGVFLHTTEDGVSWRMVGDGPFAGWEFVAVTAGVFQDHLLIGGSENTGNEYLPVIWAYDGISISDYPIADEWSVDVSVSSFLEHNGILFVGIYGHDDGAELWTFDGVEIWQRVIGGDTGFMPYSGVKFLLVHDGKLFAGIRSGGWNWFKIWFSSDGGTWSESGLSSETTLGDNHWMGKAMGSLFFSTGNHIWRQGPLYADGFETGDTSRWSSVIPAGGGPI